MADLIDTHCHVTFESFDEDRSEVLQRAREAGVRRCVAVAVDVPSAVACLELSEATDGYVVATAGLHPNDPSVLQSEAWAAAADLLASGRFVAVGETGLDIYRDHVPLEAQCASLRRHLELALELRLPVILHCRDAFEPLGEVLATFRGAPLTGVLHCFTGGPADVPGLLESGLHVGIGGIATFPRSDELRAALREIPDNRLLVETDAPFLAPVPVRGRRNEPSFVAHTAAWLAEYRGVPADELAAQTTANATILFGLEVQAAGC